MASTQKQLLLGKKPASTGLHRLGVSVAKPRKSPRVNWDSRMTRLFLQLAIKEIEAKGRGTTQLSNSSLRNIAKEMTTMMNEEINPKQIKSKCQALKRDWQAWQLLADARRGATGLGYNPVTGTFTAPPHFWTNLIAQNESVAKFRDRPMDHEELMYRVFQEVTATGHYQRTPEARGELGLGAENHRDVVEDNLEEIGDEGEHFSVGIEIGDEIGSQARSMPIPHGTDAPLHQHGTTTPLFPQHDDRSSPTFPQQGPSILPFPPQGTSTLPFPEHGTSTPPFPRAMPIYPSRDSSGNSCKTPSSGTDSTSQFMDNILETMANKKPYKSNYRYGCNMTDVMKVLGQMEYFQQEPIPPLYWWFIDFLSADPIRMEIFIGLPDNQSRLAYAQRKHTKAMQIARLAYAQGEHTKAMQIAQGQYNPSENFPTFDPPNI